MNLDKETIKKIRGLIVFTAIILIGLWNYEVVLDGLGFIGRVIFPFVLGGAIAFVLNVPMHFIEEKFFRSKKMKKNKWANKFARPYDFVCTWNHWNRCVCRSAGAGRYGDESWKKYSGVYSASTGVGGKHFSG